MHTVHHVMAVAGDPGRNHRVYAGVLGPRPVERTVDVDDTAAYRLSHASEAGEPGTGITVPRSEGGDAE